MKNILLYFKKYLYVFFLGHALFFGVVPVAHSAILYLEPSSTNIGIGDDFSVDVFIDTEGELVNAVETHVVFSDTHLTFTDIISTDSVIDFWIERGRENEGIISLSGVKTNGFRSTIDPFAVDVTTAKIATLVFEGKTVGSNLLVLTRSRVLLNDGFGTPTVTTNGSSVPVRVFSSVTGGSSVAPVVPEDTSKPEPFQIYVEQASLLPKGGTYVFFQATDRESDIEYYEVKVGNNDWKRAESPYLLQPRYCPTLVQVKAIDRGGNERIAATSVECLGVNNREVLYVLIVLAIFLFPLYVFMRKHRRKEKGSQL